MALPYLLLATIWGRLVSSKAALNAHGRGRNQQRGYWPLRGPLAAEDAAAMLSVLGTADYAPLCIFVLFQRCACRGCPGCLYLVQAICIASARRPQLPLAPRNQDGGGAQVR